MTHVQPMFDTLKFVSYLEDHGFSEKQAKGLLEAQSMVVEAQEANMVTKQDLDLRCSQLEHRMDRTIFRATLFLFASLIGVTGASIGIFTFIINNMLY